MPRQAAPSATSLHALQNAAAPSAVRMTVDPMGQAGSRDALARLAEAMQELKALSVQPLLQRAIDALNGEDFDAGGAWALKALEKDERCGVGWYLLGIARERLGDFASSVKAYEAALRLLPDHAEVANDLGRLALRMELSAQAEKLFRHFLARFPDNLEGANNLACALTRQGKLDEAVEVLKEVIARHPGVAALWNTLGTVLSDIGDIPAATIFFTEALRLDPKMTKARFNLGNSKAILGDVQGALADCEAALRNTKAPDDRQMMRLARGAFLLACGRIGEGWDEYEARLHPQFADVTHFLIDRPRWEPGAELAGKTLLVVGEQGLGDEILFANTLPDVLERLGPEGRLKLSVEPRLVAMFQRRFPQVEVSAHATYALGTRPARAAPGVDLATVELWTPIAALLREHRRSLDAFPAEARPQLTADPERVAHWRKALAAAPAGRKVGLLWKSAISKNARHRHFAQFRDWAPVLAQRGVSFVNLQYGDCAEELELARREFGVEIWSPPGIDLKQDLDEVAALCCAMDLVLGFSNATFNIAAACGAPCWLITTPGAWPRLGTPDRYPWYPQTRVFAPSAYGEWEPVMTEVAEALAAPAGSER